MKEFFELVKFKDCNDIQLGFSADNVYLGCNGVTLLDAKSGYSEVFSILQELSTEEFNTSPLYFKIGELCILSCLYQEREFIESITPGTLEYRLKTAKYVAECINNVLKFVPNVDVNELLNKSRLNNIYQLTWVGNEFASEDYLDFNNLLEFRLNQTKLCIDDCGIACLLINVGDILENIESDYYDEDYHFSSKTVCSETYDYLELVPKKVELMNKIANEDIKISFISESMKASALDDLIDDVVYCTARVNYYDELDNEFFINLKDYIRVLAMAPTVY